LILVYGVFSFLNFSLKIVSGKFIQMHPCSTKTSDNHLAISILSWVT